MQLAGSAFRRVYIREELPRSKSRRNDVSRRDEISFKKLQFSLRRPHTRLAAAATAAAVVIVAAPRRLSIYSACVVTTCAAFAPSFYSHAGGARGRNISFSFHQIV